jgi:hypothetical protein
MAESLKKLYNCIIRYCTGAPCMWPSRKRKFIHFPMHIFHFVNVVFLYGCSSSVILFLWKWARFLYLDPSRSTGSSSLLKSSSSFSVKILALGGRSVALSYSSPNRNRESANEACDENQWELPGLQPHEKASGSWIRSNFPRVKGS